MPTVPTYNGPQLKTQALQPSYQSNVDVSSGARAVAQGLGQLAEGFDRKAEREAEVAANKTDTDIAAGWLKWDAENRKKYQGENVGGYAPAAQEWWAKAAQEHGENLDPRAREKVTQALARRQAVAMGSVAQYTETTKESHADEVAAASISTTIQFGVSTGDVVGAADRVRTLASEVGARKGWKTEQVQAEVNKNLSALHLAQISKLAESNPQKAQEYYDANKAEVGFTQQPRVEEILRKEVDNQFATTFAAQQAGKTLSEQLSAAGEIKDPNRREKALQEVKNNHAMVEQAKREREQAVSDQAWQLVGQGKRVPESVLASMDGKERVQLQEHLRARAERITKGTPIKTDMATYIDVRERLAAGENVNLKALTEKIAPAQMEQLLDIKSAVGKAGSKQDGMLTDEQRINTALTGMGIDKKKDPNAAGQFSVEVDRRVRAASAAKGDKPLTPDEKQKIVDDVSLDKVFVDGWWSDTQKPLYSLKPEEMGKAYVTVGGKNVPLSTVPLADRAEITRARRARGLPTTEQAIVETYMRANPTAKPPKPIGPPSIYASPEEWDAYRKQQATDKKAP
jgi:hypothetical protein